MITRATLSTIEQGLPKYRSMLAGNSAYSPGAYDSIASATGSGTTSITFSSIPSTYQHLQLRMYNATTLDGYFRIRINGNTTDYTRHYLSADGTGSPALQNDASLAGIYYLYFVTAGQTYPPVNIMDIHNYASTSQKKTIRLFGGVDLNAAYNELWIASYMFNNTAAISSITIDTQGAGNFTSTNYVGLYGIKGA